MPILAIVVTTIECDGRDGAGCPDSTTIEYQHPQSVAIRLAKQSGWTVWLETLCPECSKLPVADEPEPAAPEVRFADTVPAVMVLEAGAGASTWCAQVNAERRRTPAYA
ncbi:hypothetical protein [Paenarthrobacter sp. YJN-5]|uniref:hypothetical protein n=1 Tax=Paenarthrobacter sp. YJN-5 TaxID=2735316 RepID=UPI001878EE90|nr:hypothetical protein [Paenarthrobacter sp. YJN-5]QOT19661.1 hypothetical protein HMI59_23910 [Paenarthrobacter sp. YJN-5]